MPKLCPDPAFLPVLPRLAVIVFCNLRRTVGAAKFKSPSPHHIDPKRFNLEQPLRARMALCVLDLMCNGAVPDLARPSEAVRECKRMLLTYPGRGPNAPGMSAGFSVRDFRLECASLPRTIVDCGSSGPKPSQDHRHWLLVIGWWPTLAIIKLWQRISAFG